MKFKGLMPYGMRKLPKKNLYKVYNKETGRVSAKGTTKDKAERQINRLRSLEANKPKYI